MNKEEQIKVGFRELYDKMSWLNRRKMEDSLKGYTSSEVHCMEYIEKNKDSNVTKLADSFYMTRGAISKLTKKLIKKELIESYQKSDNKKEIYFRLTEKGREVYDIHEKLHNEFSERDKVVFEQVTDEQFNSMLQFVELYSQHLDKEIKKVTLNTKSE
ncbi:MarR family transcriptional regulator [Carnobacterium maltaromaticum]|uniref:MarR family transcriptional regulator n=1 Tax=Carnobacterium TaxID=2747 RepID=UPI00026C8937|nr:MarR family transcriptional regulator [Carnobacterium maltaromaticum]KRN84158.1 MarR family transcriptional regulator [Carnobacterium maltaromaticum]MDT1943388.1 MarR family transcriptional regulator [Carnobacterium maltaromaticum]MDT1998768.1 MarR family transcriptional regulator [Carnobacterium maltaromaticum]TFJ24786.1 MarR family transcriptional regulator [Carnobacterium maltaromaticum]TFJ30191.1 MarR family transcriptional regulator [Carnobacterium maltaromaticum]